MSLSTLTLYAKSKIKESYYDKIVCDNYQILDYIGNGAYCFVFSACKINDKSKAIKNNKYAVKIEQKKRTFIYGATLSREAKILKSLKSARGFAKLYSFVQNPQENIMVTQILGKNLKELFLESKRRFSLQTILLIGCQLVNRIESLHEKGYIHRDIKPSNVCIDYDTQDVLYLIDFGLANSYRKKDGSHIQFKSNVGYCGTQNYMSINSHSGYEQSRRDDLMSLFYLLLYLAKGKLPWNAKKGEDEDSRNFRIGQKKASVNMEYICNKLPDLFIKYFRYVNDLQFIEYPNYEYLKNLFKNELLKMASNTNSQLKFDWQEENQELILQKIKCESTYSKVSIDSRQSSVATKKSVKHKGCLKKSTSVVMNNKQNQISQNQSFQSFGKKATFIMKKPQNNQNKNLLNSNSIKQNSITNSKKYDIQKNEKDNSQNTDITWSPSVIPVNNSNTNCLQSQELGNFHLSQGDSIKENTSQNNDEQSQNSKKQKQQYPENFLNKSDDEIQKKSYKYSTTTNNFYCINNMDNINNNSLLNNSKKVLIQENNEKQKIVEVVRENRFFRKEEIDNQTEFSKYNRSESKTEFNTQFNENSSQTNKENSFFSQKNKCQQELDKNNNTSIDIKPIKNKDQPQQQQNQIEDETCSKIFSTKTNMESQYSNNNNNQKNSNKNLNNIFRQISETQEQNSNNLLDQSELNPQEDQEVSIKSKEINYLEYNYSSSLTVQQKQKSSQLSNNIQNSQNSTIDSQIQVLNSFQYNVKQINKLQYNFKNNN